MQNNHVGFGNYNKNFQEKIFQSLMSDKEWAQQMVEVMNPAFFEVSYLEYLADKFFAYFRKYRCFPTMGLLVTIVKDDLSGSDDLILRDQIVQFLHRVRTNADMADLAYVKDKSLDFCRKQAFKDALEKAVDLIQTEKFEDVVTLMKTAVSVGLPSSVGHDFFEDVEARFVKVNRQVCPTGLPKLDTKDILNGGVGRGELACIVAPTGVGKSHFLVAMGASAMRVGKNVLHYTFELSEYNVGLRYDSNLCDMPSNEVQDRKEEVLKKYEDMDLGRLIIKEYPTGSASVITLRKHIEKLTLKGFKPSIIIIDYADIMRSTRTYDSLRHELKLVYEELRNLAMELNVAVWTASQANREAANADIVGLENMSEAYGKAMICDIVMSISRKATEKSSNAGRLFVAKNRAGRDGLVFPLCINTAKSTFEILGEDALTLNEAMGQSESDMKNLLKTKWKEVNKIKVDE
jgi:replicative DNA helicase